MRWMVFWVAMSGLAWADGEAAGDFDYYVMALSWSPNFCAIEGDAKGSEQCDPALDHGWVLHGLWPQYENGWPSFCNTIERNPPKSMTASMDDIMGSSGLAWYQWKKHGRCAGLPASDYFTLARRAYDSVTRPPVLRKLDKTVALPASVVEDAWLDVNPELDRKGVTVTCRDGRIMETRICLTKDLEPRDCGVDVARDCTLSKALFDPVR